MAFTPIIEKEMQEYKTSINEIKKLKREVKRLEDEIDEAVYKLYGLKEEDIAVIRDYLGAD